MNILFELGFYNLKKKHLHSEIPYITLLITVYKSYMLLVKGCKIVCLVNPGGSFSRYNFLYMI